MASMGQGWCPPLGVQGPSSDSEAKPRADPDSSSCVWELGFMGLPLFKTS